MRRELRVLWNGLILLLLLSVSLTACGGGAAPAVGVPTAGPPPKVGTIKVGVSPDWEPWESLDKDTQKPVGFDVDLMNTIAKEAGFQVEFVQAPFDKLLDGVGKDYDAAIGALLIDDARSNAVAFSNPYQNTGLVLVMPMINRALWGIADVAGKKAGALAGSPGEAEINKVDPKALVTFQTNAEMFKDLSSSQRTLDSIVTDYLTAAQEIARTPDALKNGPPFTDAKLGIAVAKSRPDVLAAINAGLKLATDNYLVKDEVNQWLSVPPEKRPAGFVFHSGR
jgi:ABC-type amino acid transport substrate-binding protein